LLSAVRTITTTAAVASSNNHAAVASSSNHAAAITTITTAERYGLIRACRITLGRRNG
jgi:hypothetical protein